MAERSPWREPMVWLMIGLPAASVVFGIALAVTAVCSGGADSISDEVQHIAQMQITEQAPDARATSMKLSAVLRLEEEAIEVLPVSGEFIRTQVLMLTLSHPTDAMQDRHLILQPTELGWRVTGNTRANHDWIAQLTPTDAQWRVRGRIKAGQRAAFLQPIHSGN